MSLVLSNFFIVRLLALAILIAGMEKRRKSKSPKSLAGLSD